MTAKSGSRHIPKRRAARAVLDHEPLGGAAAGLELRPDAGQTRRQQRRRGRTRRSCGRIGQAEVGDCPAPPIGWGGQEDEVRFPAEQAPAEEILRSVGDFRRPAIRTGRVQAAEPDGPAVAQRNIEALIDADRLDPPAWAAASGKAGRRHHHDRQRGAGDTKSQGAGEPSPGAAAVRGAEIHAKGLAARRPALSRAFWRLRC